MCWQKASYHIVPIPNKPLLPMARNKEKETTPTNSSQLRIPKFPLPKANNTQTVPCTDNHSFLLTSFAAYHKGMSLGMIEKTDGNG